MTWLPTTAPGGATPFDRVFGLRPDAHERFIELYDGLWAGGVDAATLDLVRDRVDALLQCAPDPVDWAACTGAQRACLAFAEQYVLDPHGLTDADFERLHDHLPPPQIATLVLAVAMFDARARFACALEVQ